MMPQIKISKILCTASLVFILLFSEHSAQTQALITTDQYTYFDTSGNFYVQKSQPIYLWLGFEPDSNLATHLLKSDTSRQFTNPMYFNNEGLNLIRSPWAVDTQTHIRVYPLEEIAFEIYADGIPPKTRLIYGDAKLNRINGVNYLGHDLEIILESKDTGSGLASIYYSLNNQPFSSYSQPIRCSEENTYHIQYYAIDNVGNTESLKTFAFTTDLSPPVTEITVSGDRHENILSKRSEMILEAEDNISGVSAIKVSVDDGPESIYRGPLKASFLSQGVHVLKYYASDQAGNKEPVKTFEFFIDNTPPILVEEIQGNSFMNNGREYSSGRSKLKLTAVDNKAGVKAIYYSLNGEEYQLYEKPFYLSAISGSLNVTSYATDHVNNQSTASRNTTKRNITYIDLTGPEIKIAFDGPVFRIVDSTYINKTTKILLKAIDEESGYKSMDYNVDGQAMQTYTEPFTIESSGLHKITANAFDNVNNSNVSEFSIIVDNQGPEVFSRFSILPLTTTESENGSINVYSSQVVLFLSVTDSRIAIDKIYYQINDEPEQQYLSYIGGFKQGIEYQVKVRATDKLGNASFETIRFATDNSGPEIFTQFSTPVKVQKELNGNTVNVYPAFVSLFLSVTNAHIAYEKIFYSINGGSEKIYTGVIENFPAHTDIIMKIRAIDQLGNQTSKVISFAIE